MKLLTITPAELEIVRTILARLVPEREVWAFGSRVTGPVKKFSDLDLAVMGAVPLAAALLADLEEGFRESDLPFKVDVVDRATTQENFRRIIEQAYVVVQRGKGLEQGKQEKSIDRSRQDKPGKGGRSRN